jgi:hypothetical protein
MKSIVISPLANGWVEFFTRVELCEGNEYIQRGYHTPQSAVGQLIWTIPGIQTMRIHGYHLVIEKSPAFEWDEITPQIVEILEGLNGIGKEKS